MNQFATFLAQRTAGRGQLAQLARASGFHLQMLMRWRNGENRPTPESLVRLAPHLGYSYDDLMKMCGYPTEGRTVGQEELTDPVLVDLIQSWPSLSDERRGIIRLLVSSAPDSFVPYVGQDLLCAVA